MAEHSAVNRRVVGSSPTWGARNMKSESERFGFFCCLFLPHHKMVRFLEKLWLDFISPVAKEVKSMYNDMDKIEVEGKLSLISYGIQKRRIRHGNDTKDTAGKASGCAEELWF